MDRRTFVEIAVTSAAALALHIPGRATEDVDLAIRKEIEKRHDETVARLREWIHQPSIAAEDKGMNEGCDLTMRLLRDAGFSEVTRIPTAGYPVIFGTLDAGAQHTLALYFMYDVKQVDPAEWSSPPWDGALVDKPGLGKVLVGRGAVNQKGPQAAFLGALHVIRGAGRKLPVNLVIVAEGEEEIGSEHLPQVVRRPEVEVALHRSLGIFMPEAAQGLDGSVSITLGAKGDVEVELIASGERWEHGPDHDIHSSNAARVDNPAWHLVQALSTLVSPAGDPAVDNFEAKVRPLSPTEKAMIADAALRIDESSVKKQLGVQRWIHDASWQEAIERMMSRPTITIEGLIGGYTGPGGKTVLPHRASAKLDMRLVPDMTADDALSALKAHLAKRGFADIEIKINGGAYGPTSTPGDSALIQIEKEVYRSLGVDPVVLPRSAGSWPGYIFTDPPLQLPAGHFGLGHGSGAHAPNEYYVIESSNPKIQGIDGAVDSFVRYLFDLARMG